MASPRRRLRFESVHHQTSVDGRCRVRVRLEWRDEHHEVEAEGLETHQGRLQAAASATLGAALIGAGTRFDADVVGVKAVRAFDGWVVVVRLSARIDDQTVRLLGAASCEVEQELARSTALAVLDATNRLLEKSLVENEGGPSGSREQI